jgi:branched-chain amino acid transport system permease protein
MAQPPRDGREAGAAQPKIGVDEWVARREERLERRTGLAGVVERALERLPPLAALGLVIAPAAVFPMLPVSDYVVRVGVNTLLFALLALGLNVVVGFAGLLDLGYIAFYGFGAYSYALLSSDKFDIHLPTIASIPLIVVAAAALGLLLGLPSRRLLGDYLAIVTLFFAQIFVLVVNNANRITPPWSESPIDFTGGPNGIADLDPHEFFGLELTSVTGYYYEALVAFALIMTALYLLNESRTGRAWRAVREDPLAAELMGMPINALKLMAFAFGAGIAGLTGTIFAALQVGVFPGNFDLALLITIYVMLFVGGAGSLGGVVLGAFAINVALEILRTPDNARLLFYGLVVVCVVVWIRPWRWVAAVLAGAIAFGFAVHTLVTTAWPEATKGDDTAAGTAGGWIDSWVVLVADSDKRIGNAALLAVVVAVLALTLLRRRYRLVATVPVLYLAAFAWENRLILDPSISRLVFLGALLVGLMIARPQGLLGTARVEIA